MNLHILRYPTFYFVMWYDNLPIYVVRPRFFFHAQWCWCFYNVFSAHDNSSTPLCWIWNNHCFLKNNFPLIETLLEYGAKASVGKNSEGSQVLHVQAEKADELDLSNLYPDAHVVSDSILLNNKY